MTTPLLDFKRFPGRRWSLGFSAEMRETLERIPDMATAVRARWAQHVRARTDDILLFATAEDAMRAAVHALLAPNDVVLLARPLPPDWIACVLQAGARYVDVGRRYDGFAQTGGWNVAAAQRAAAAHPEAVAIAETCTWGGADDAAVAAALPLRAFIKDARNTLHCLGPVLGLERATVTLVALRDPDAPSPAVLYALIAPDQHGAALRAAVGPTAVPAVLAEHAFAVLEGVDRDPTWADRAIARITERNAAWRTALAGRPGVEVLPPAGTEAAALCLGGDGDAIAADLVGQFLTVRAWPTSAMRALLTADLAR